MKGIISFLILMSTLLSSVYAQNKADIMDVFQSAYLYDPTFRQKIAQTLSSQENIGINLSALLPHINFKMRPSEDKQQNSGALTKNTLPRNNVIRSNEMTLSLHQTIFNYGKYARLKNANLTAKEACASLSAAFQNLIIRVAKAYFNVLQDEESLIYCRANKAALARQYKEAQERFKINAIPITDLYNVKSTYYGAVTSCVKSQTDLAIDKNFLTTLTNQYYPDLAKLSDHFPLIKPNPFDAQAWIVIARQQNWDIKANKLAVEAAKATIRQRFAGHFPTIDVEAYYDVTPLHSQQGSLLVSQGSSKLKNKMLSINLNVPIFSGGQVTSEVNQAEFDYESSAQQLEYTIRNTIYTTQQNYFSLISDIQNIYNDKIAIQAASLALQATNERYKAGMGTQVDILNQREKLFHNQLQYAKDKYSYILNLLALKNSAGTLNVNDLKIINAWLLS